jgi:Rieske Fe-S protein
VADLINNRDNAWAKLYDPGRITINRESAQEYIKENVNVAIEYTELLTGGDVSSVDDIPKGSGAVMRRGITKVAVYKDEKGTTHECSAICPHLHCVVHWNGLEKSWDCPCHGSRFSALGELLNGPAATGLGPA